MPYGVDLVVLRSEEAVVRGAQECHLESVGGAVLSGVGGRGRGPGGRPGRIAGRRGRGVTNQAGAERIQGVFRDQLLPVARQVCPDPEQVPARAALCAAQLLGLALTRFVLRMPASQALTREELVAWMGPTVQRYLTAPNP